MSERRLAQLDLAARAKFAEHGETVHDTRSMIDDLIYGPDSGPDLADSTNSVADLMVAGLMEVD